MSLTLAMSVWMNLLLGGVEIDLNMAQSSINFSHTLAFALVRSILSVNQILLYFDFTLADASFLFLCGSQSCVCCAMLITIFFVSFFIFEY